MPEFLELAPIRLGLLVVIAAAGLAAAAILAKRTSWGPAGYLAVIAATPLVPSMPVGYGLSTDDVLPAVGAIVGLTVVDLTQAGRVGWPRLLVIGAVLMALAGVVSSVVNAAGSSMAIVMILKSAGHIVFLSLIAVSVVLAMPVERRHAFVARAIALVATFEAGFGLVAWLLPLPWMAGLEPSRQMTSLLGHVPGRVAGTIGLSPNFLGAIFVLSIPITTALALRAVDRRSRLLWWTAVVAQLVALALTFTRTSLGIALAILIVMLLIRGHARVLLALGALVLVVATVTPLGGRLLGDANDRAALWSSAVLMMVDHPIAGVGPGHTLEVAQANPGRYRDTPFGRATNNAHNTVLLAGAEAGVPGAVGALLVNLSLAASALAVLLLAAGPPRLRAGAMGGRTADLMAAAALGGLGFLVQGMTNNLFAVRVTSVMGTLVFAAFLIPPAVPIGRVLARVRGSASDRPKVG